MRIFCNGFICYSLSVCMLQAGDITKDIYNLKNANNIATDTFFATSTTTYSSGGTSFTQSYSNGTLILGNSTQAPVSYTHLRAHET